MAEGSNREVQRAINMLHEAANLISTSMNRGTISVDNTPISLPQTLVENPSVVTNVTQTATTSSTLPMTTSTCSEAVPQNFRSLFDSYRSQEHPPLRSRNQRVSQPPAKRLKRQSFFIPKETWTHKFFCLAETDTDRIPNRQEKFIWAPRIRRSWFKRSWKMHFLNSSSHGFGFEILRSGATVKELVIIIPPANVGYAVPFFTK